MERTIRKAGLDDAEILARLNQTVQDLHVAHFPDIFKPFDHDAVVGWFGSMLQKSNVHAWISEFDDFAVGYTLTVTHERIETALCFARQTCEIDQIAVLPAYRRMGIARSLIACAFEDARSRGIRELELSSWSFNAEAHAAFQALGFNQKMARFWCSIF